MLVFIDESGDTGLNISQGSSPFFTVAVVLFENDEEALTCDQRIQSLKKELKYPPDFEFHFYHNSRRTRIKFLETVASYDFFYFGFVINKNPDKLYGEGFRHRESCYKYVCGLVFENAKPYLKETKVKLDKSGRAVFRSQLAKYLKQKINSDKTQLIKSVKMERSSSNNLLQLADYVAGVINRKVQGKSDYEIYYRYLAPREMHVQVWPK